jgi:hypothetical protein
VRRFSWAFTPNGGEYVGKVLYLKKDGKKSRFKILICNGIHILTRYFGSWFVLF